MITVKDINGNTLAQLAVSDNSSRRCTMMDDDMLELEFELAETVSFPIRCYVDFMSRRYFLFTQPEITKKHNRLFEYKMVMYTDAYMLGITTMRNITIDYKQTPMVIGGDKRIKFPLTATPGEHLQMIADCLNASENGTRWTVDYAHCVGMVEDPGGDYEQGGVRYADNGAEVLVCYDSVYCIDALRGVAEACSSEFEVLGTSLLLHMVEYNKDMPLEMAYGKGNGFESGVVRRNDTSVPPIDRLYVIGGEQNIPEHYGQTNTGTSQNPHWVGEKSVTLMLPQYVSWIHYDGKTVTVELEYSSTLKEYYFNEDLAYTYTADGHGNYTYTGHGGRGTYTNTVPPELAVINNDLSPRFKVSEDRRSIYRVTYNTTTHQWDKPYRDTNVEAVYDGSEVYPMRIGEVSYVQKVNNDGTPQTGAASDDKETFYDIFDDDPDLYPTTSGGVTTPAKLDYKTCGIPNEVMTIIFQDGMLAGREFDIQTIEESGTNKPNCRIKAVVISGVTYNKYCIPLCQSDVDGVTMPGDVFVPAEGDHYAVFHCQLPSSYVTNAELRMLHEAVDYLFYHGEYTYTFEGNVYTKWAKQNWNTLSPIMVIGQYIKATDVQLFGANGLKMRIAGITQNINVPQKIELSLTNAVMHIFDWPKLLSKTVKKANTMPTILRPNQFVLPQFGPASRNFGNDYHRADGNSRRNPSTTLLREVGTTLDETQTYLQKLQKVSKIIRDCLADEENINNVYRDKSGYIMYVDERGSAQQFPFVGDNGTCSAYTQTCREDDISIDVPDDVKE